MPLYRSRPKVVEAVQYFPGNHVPGVFMHTPPDVVLHSRVPHEPPQFFPQDPYPAVRTMQGEVVRIKPGEWAIKEQRGEGYYPCDPGEFVKLYDTRPIDPEDSSVNPEYTTRVGHPSGASLPLAGETARNYSSFSITGCQHVPERDPRGDASPLSGDTSTSYDVSPDRLALSRAAIGKMRTLLFELMKRDALKTGDFTLSSGKASNYYVDCRKVTLSAVGANLISSLMLEVFVEWGETIDAVGGPTIGADPIVGAILGKLGRSGYDCSGFLVRKEAKGHGTGNLVEGPLEPGMRVVIVEDVATSGASVLRAVDAVLAMGCTVAGVVVVLDRLEGAAAAFAARDIPFVALATIRDLGVEPLTT